MLQTNSYLYTVSFYYASKYFSDKIGINQLAVSFYADCVVHHIINTYNMLIDI